MVKVKSGAIKEEGSVKRKGFKQDRSAKFMESRTKGKKKKLVPRKAAVKEIKFDNEARRDYVLGFHRRKNERRAQAQFQVRVTHRKKVQSDRQDMREAARQQYNALMQVPIGPDFTLDLQPKVGETRTEEVEMSSKATYGQGKVVVTTEPLVLNEHTEETIAPLVAKALQKQKDKKAALLKPKFDLQKELALIRKVQKHSRKSKRKKQEQKRGGKNKFKKTNQHRH